MTTHHNQENTNQTQETQHEFGIQRIYTKDLSYETPHTPDIFQNEWTPEVDMNLQTDSKKLAENIYEVVLHITVTAKLKNKIAFLVEVKQAGIFAIKNFTKEQLDPMLGSFCPNILFPYAREIISTTISRGSFPVLHLAPINFDAFYQDKIEKTK